MVMTDRWLLLFDDSGAAEWPVRGGVENRVPNNQLSHAHIKN